MGNVYLVLAIVTEVVGTLALQASEGFTRLLPSLTVIIGYVLSFYFLGLTLKISPLGMAVIYAIWSGLGLVLITILGMLFFKEVPDLPAILGMALIIAGVTVINLFSKGVH